MSTCVRDFKNSHFSKGGRQWYAGWPPQGGREEICSFYYVRMRNFGGWNTLWRGFMLTLIWPFEKEANEGIESLQFAIVFIKTTHQFFDGPPYKSVNSWNHGRTCSFRIQNYIIKILPCFATNQLRSSLHLQPNFSNSQHTTTTKIEYIEISQYSQARQFQLLQIRGNVRNGLKCFLNKYLMFSEKFSEIFCENSTRILDCHIQGAKYLDTA